MRRIAVVTCLIVLAGCKAKPGAKPLDKDDGKGKTHDCPLVAGGLITKDTVIQAGCLVTVGEAYTIRNGATLRIEQGARFAFKKGARIHAEDGAIVAQGTKSEPIVFTSADASPAAGAWGGLWFSSTKPSSLASVVIEWAGEEPKLPPKTTTDPKAAKAAALADAAEFGIIGILNGGFVGFGSRDPIADRRPAIYVAKEGKLALVDSVVRHAARVGIAADGDAPFEAFERNELADNGGFAMDVKAEAMGKVLSITSAEPVRVRGNVSTTQSWPRVEGGIVVASLEVVAKEKGASVVLTLAPESTVRVEPKTSLRFGGYSEGGAVVAKKVLFTSATAKPAPGDWAGIVFDKRAPGTSLDGCIVEYAGYETPRPPTTAKSKKEKPAPKPPALSVKEWMKDFQVVRTTFRNNAGPGMAKAEYAFAAFGGGTGGCEGLDNPKFENKSVGQPLCEYHEDPLKDVFGPSAAFSDLGPQDLMGSGGLGIGTGAGSGSGVGLGSTGGYGGGGGGWGTGVGGGGAGVLAPGGGGKGTK
ncbi:MAG: hypothetical protein ACXWUG_23265 [Polyangiales bacterium]